MSDLLFRPLTQQIDALVRRSVLRRTCYQSYVPVAQRLEVVRRLGSGLAIVT